MLMFCLEDLRLGPLRGPPVATPLALITDLLIAYTLPSRLNRQFYFYSAKHVLYHVISKVKLYCDCQWKTHIIK